MKTLRCPLRFLWTPRCSSLAERKLRRTCRARTLFPPYAPCTIQTRGSGRFRGFHCQKIPREWEDSTESCRKPDAALCCFPESLPNAFRSACWFSEIPFSLGDMQYWFSSFL